MLASREDDTERSDPTTQVENASIENAISTALNDLKAAIGTSLRGSKFHNKISSINDAITTAGMTHEMILNNIISVMNIYKTPGVSTLKKLFKCVKENQAASENRSTGGKATVAGGGLFGSAAAAVLVVSSIASLPVAAGVGVGIFFASTAAGVGVAVDAKNKRGKLGLLELDIINKVMSVFWQHAQYKNYARASLEQIKINAQYNSANEFRDAYLNACITNIKKLPNDDLFDICQQLFTTLDNLKNDKTTENIIHLIEQFNHQLLMNCQYRQHTIVSLQLVSINAINRSNNTERDQRLTKLLNKLPKTQNLIEMNDKINKASAKLHSKTWNTSTCAIELEVLVINQLFHNLSKNILLLPIDDVFPLSQQLLTTFDRLKNHDPAKTGQVNYIDLMKHVRERLHTDVNQVINYTIVSIQHIMMIANTRKTDEKRNSRLNNLLSSLLTLKDQDMQDAVALTSTIFTSLNSTIEQLRADTWSGNSDTADDLSALATLVWTLNTAPSNCYTSLTM